jgi:uncharacterized 2Fe-2S/4Fe-4S cluster protein (DUF4445 family)
MSDKITLRLEPLGMDIFAKPGTPLPELLAKHGVEFSCAGKGICGRCKIKLTQGQLDGRPTPNDFLTRDEIDQGFWLACQSRVTSSATIEIGRWETSVLATHVRLPLPKGHGIAIAVDVGTTTLVAQAVDLATGGLLANETALNPQCEFGDDIMSRIEFALTETGQEKLSRTIRNKIGKMIGAIRETLGDRAKDLGAVALTGNTVMHHLFCGHNIDGLGAYPFEPETTDPWQSTAGAIGWPLPQNTPVRFLPCLGGFVGSDVLAGALACGLDTTDDLCMLIDLGTNGEVVLGNRNRLLFASAAAGPAFEGGRISHGMRACSGAIERVFIKGHKLGCKTIGNDTPRGICGSGLVDAVAGALDLGWVLPDGRITLPDKSIPLAKPIRLTQKDVRELQLAKGAVAAGAAILLDTWGATPDDIHTIYLAGAFGNNLDIANALRIGLLEFPANKIIPVGNAALAGAKSSLAGGDGFIERANHFRAISTEVSLALHEAFTRVFAQKTAFGPAPKSP